jgi:hypothetical protein
MSAIDRTRGAVERQLQALGCELYEIGLREASTGRMMNRTFPPHEVVRRRAWFKRMNARGNDIYVRPATESTRQGLVLVDDLSREALEALDRAGHEPCVITETSPANFQAWIRLGTNVPAELRAAVAKRLAREHGGDLGSTDARHYGRLAGFTNAKPERRREDGLAPFVLLHRAHARDASAAASLLADAGTAIAAEPSPPRAFRLRVHEPDASARAAFAIAFERLVAKYAGDASRADLGAALYLLSHGYPEEQVADAMLACSPQLELRKKGRVEPYVRRTLARALSYRSA